jgi:hypothetical protein
MAMTTKKTPDVTTDGEPEDRRASWALMQIQNALRGLQYGQVCVTVQDGVVVQVERTERHRFQRRSTAS